MKNYYKHSIKNTVTVRNIFTIEYLELSSNFSYPKEKHEFWELVYVDKGKIRYYINDTPTIIEHNDILFLHPGEFHNIESLPDIETNLFVLCFECKSQLMNSFIDYKSKLGKQDKYLLSKIIEETQHTYKLPFKEKLEIAGNPNLGGEQAITIYLELLLLSFLRRMNEQNIPIFINSEDFSAEVVNVVKQYFKENIYKRISIPDLCKTLNYSKSFLSRLFKSVTGESIINYYNREKIEEAKKLIREGNKAMSEISDILSYSDPRYFNTAFKAVAKMTPKEYRNSIKK